MSVSPLPQSVAHMFARAKSQLKRDDSTRALENMLAGLAGFEPKKYAAKTRFEIEVLILECVMELNRQPAVRELFAALSKKSKTAQVAYTPGQEKKLAGVLTLLHKALADKVAAGEEDAAAAKAKRRAMLEQKGLVYLQSGNFPRGKAALRVLAEEFGKEPGVLRQASEWLLEFKLHFEAAELLEQAMEHFPKDSKSYGLAAQCYIDVREFEKAEAVYQSAIRQFGRHPRTLLNLAKVYVAWNKKEAAFTTAQDALNKDDSLEEARAIVEKYA